MIHYYQISIEDKEDNRVYKSITKININKSWESTRGHIIKEFKHNNFAVLELIKTTKENYINRVLI